MEDNILLIERKGHVCTLTLNRPAKRNSLSPDLLIKLHQTLDDFGQGDDVRAVVIRGAGDKAFSSGYDIAAIPTDVPPEVQERLREQSPLELAINSVINYPYPVIAMLNGYAFGAGCELAVCCDLRVAVDDVRMGMPPAKLGLVYPLWGLMRFVQIVGFPGTKELFFTGRYFDAPRVKEMGLINYLLPRAELETFTYALAEEIAANAPLSVKGTKRILGLLARSFKISDQALGEAEEVLAQAFNSEDLKEGQRAFMEKRRPVFKGR
ncbi:MAG: enoyl-CoA hydratase-related protein [Pseudomonadota bacterium]